jgi:hypothetical protein
MSVSSIDTPNFQRLREKMCLLANVPLEQWLSLDYWKDLKEKFQLQSIDYIATNCDCGKANITQASFWVCNKQILTVGLCCIERFYHDHGLVLCFRGLYQGIINEYVIHQAYIKKIITKQECGFLISIYTKRGLNSGDLVRYNEIGNRIIFILSPNLKLKPKELCGSCRNCQFEASFHRIIVDCKNCQLNNKYFKAILKRKL